MTTFGLIVLGVVIGANNLATALALGALGEAPRKWRVVLTFGVFEFVIPLIGLWIGQRAAVWLVEHAHWLSGALLIALGVIAIIAGVRKSDGREQRLAHAATSFAGLTLLASGLSLDNLIVGFSLGLRDARPFVVAGTIATFSMTFTWIGMTLGDSSRRHWEKPAEVATGVLLVGIGIASLLGWL